MRYDLLFYYWLLSWEEIKLVYHIELVVCVCVWQHCTFGFSSVRFLVVRLITSAKKYDWRVCVLFFFLSVFIYRICWYLTSTTHWKHQECDRGAHCLAWALHSTRTPAPISSGYIVGCRKSVTERDSRPNRWCWKFLHIFFSVCSTPFSVNYSTNNNK